MHLKTIIFTILILSIGFASTSINVVESDQTKLKISFNVNLISENDLKPFYILVGLPNNSLPNLSISNTGLHDHNFSDINDIESRVEWFQIQKLRGLWVGTLKIEPGVIGYKYYSNILIDMNLNGSNSSSIPKKNDAILESKIVNWDAAKYWVETKPRSLAKVQNIPDGIWINFKVDHDGMYKIGGTELTDVFSSIANYDTRSFMLFAGINQGRAQDQTPGITSAGQNLKEIPFQYSGTSGGTFSENDELIFYGRGASGFDNKGTNITYNKNLYFTDNNYWLLIPSDQSLRGKHVKTAISSSSPNLSIDYGIRYLHIENDLVNPFGSGLGWAEQSITTNSSLVKSIDIANSVGDVPVLLTTGFIGSSTAMNTHPYPLNSVAIGINAEQSDNIGSTVWSGLNDRNKSFTISNDLINNGNNSLYLTNISNDSYSQPYFDYLTLSFGQKLIYDSSEFEFYAPIHSNNINYSINSDSDVDIWKITNPATPVDITINQSNNQYDFTITTPADTLDRFIAFDKDEISAVKDLQYIGEHSFSNFANTSIQADHVIISKSGYSEVAAKLVAHRDNSIFVSLETIYNDFSGGNADPMGIRNFIDWTQNNWQSPNPQEFFIIGDADYDYRNITGNSNNVVPTIEVGVSGSFATDDRLATINGSIPEVALGRFPAQSVAEAQNYIEKLIEFENNPEFGLWRQRVTLIADDGARPEDSPSELQIGKSHTLNSELLAEIIPNEVETKKLYMLEYPEESNTTSFGVAKPEATAALLDILEKGTAVVNYIGHGSAHQWAQERLLYQDRGDLQSINTGMKLPVWIAGTCSWGHFDNIGSESFSEELIRQEMNGAAAIITTSRAITVTSNQYYEEQLFRQLFPDGDVSKQSIGVILQSIKTGNQEGQYFHLFGDPGMKLPIPQNKIFIKSVSPDTLVTLEESDFTATQNLSDFGGIGYTIVMEDEREVTREYNYLSNVESLTYKLPGSTLFRGQLSFSGNDINGQFRIPKDVSSNSESTSLKIYAYTNDDQPLEGLGIIDSLRIIHGADTNDEFGPIITFQTNSGRILMSGDHVIENESIIIRLTDPLGINLAGEPGHDIVLYDHLQDSETILTNQFIYDANSITTGTIPLDIDNNDSEVHITLKAWDSANNPSENEIELILIKDAKLKLFNVLNYPNPFAHSTQFTFEISQSAEISITIYTLGGRKIMEFNSEYYEAGFHNVDWNGKDAFGDKLANGVYLYKVKAKNDSESTSFIGRLAKYE